LRYVADLPDLDNDAICPKCCGSKVSTRYAETNYCEYLSPCSSLRDRERGHMHRTCQTCGYGWLERPWDIPRSDAAQPDAAG